MKPNPFLKPYKQEHNSLICICKEEKGKFISKNLRSYSCIDSTQAIFNFNNAQDRLRQYLAYFFSFVCFWSLRVTLFSYLIFMRQKGCHVLKCKSIEVECKFYLPLYAAYLRLYIHFGECACFKRFRCWHLFVC